MNLTVIVSLLWSQIVITVFVRPSECHGYDLLMGIILWSCLLQNDSADISLPGTNQIRENVDVQQALCFELEHSMTPIKIMKYLDLFP